MSWSHGGWHRANKDRLDDRASRNHPEGMSDDLEIKRGVTIPGWELWHTTSTSGGPGGQHANKTATRVTLHWVPNATSVLSDRPVARAGMLRRLRSQLTSSGELQVSVQDTRSQSRNLELARERMADTVAKSLARRKRRRRTRPTRGSIERRIKAKKIRGEKKRLRKNPDPKKF